MKSTKSLIVAAVLVLALGSGPGWAARRLLTSGDDEFTQARERVQSLHEDISTINLLNGLNLSREQITQILQLAQEARAARERLTVNSPELMASLKDAEAAFAALKAEIQKGAPAKGDIPQRAQQINHRLKELREQANQQVNGVFKALEGKLAKVLSPEQLQVVENFSPCLIPPQDLRNPVRAGQAASNEGVINRLRRLRELPEDQWQARREMLVQRLVDRISQHQYRMTEAEKTEERARLLALADRVRRMSQVDFELEKEKLAEQFKPRDRVKELRSQLEARLPHERRPQMSRLSRFLLSDRVIPILQERLKAESLAGAR